MYIYIYIYYIYKIHLWGVLKSWGIPVAPSVPKSAGSPGRRVADGIGLLRLGASVLCWAEKSMAMLGKNMEKPWENTWKTWGVQSSDLFFSLNVRKQIGQTPGIHGFSDPNSWQFWMFIPKRKVQKLLIHPQVKHEGVANIGMGLWWGYDLPTPLITGDFPKKIWSFDHWGWVKLPLFQLPYDWGYWGNQHPAIPAILGT